MTERRIAVLERFAAIMRAGPFDQLLFVGVNEDYISKFLSGFDEDCPWEIDMIDEFIRSLLDPSLELKKLRGWYDEMTWERLMRDPDPVPEVVKMRRLKRQLRGLWKQHPKIGTERIRRGRKAQERENE